MILKSANSPNDMKNYTTDRLREEYLLTALFAIGEVRTVYSSTDRMIVGAAVPEKPIILDLGSEIKADYFLQRREMGIINIGGAGSVFVDGKEYVLDVFDGLYIGKGSKEIIFHSQSEEKPSKFYFNSVPAHKVFPNVKICIDGRNDEDTTVIKAENKITLGSLAESNHRTITKYILPGQVESCQLVMGMTTLNTGSVWNTMPCHTHDRRMEVYLYLNLPADAFVMHYMGKPEETRHIVVRNEEAVISPEWSIHAGCGTKCYSFIWGMAGENQTFSDMDTVPLESIF